MVKSVSQSNKQLTNKGKQPHPSWLNDERNDGFACLTSTSLVTSLTPRKKKSMEVARETWADKTGVFQWQNVHTTIIQLKIQIVSNRTWTITNWKTALEIQHFDDFMRVSCGWLPVHQTPHALILAGCLSWRSRCAALWLCFGGWVPRKLTVRTWLGGRWVSWNTFRPPDSWYVSFLGV